MALIEKQEYIYKINNFINENKCTPIEKNPTNKFQQQKKQLMKTFPKLFRDNHSVEMKKNDIHTLNYKWINSNPSPPITLLKVHKENTPIRPVVNRMNSPNYKLSKYIARLIKEKIILENKYKIRNSYELANKTKQKIRITKDTKYESFDIKNLYTSLLVNETLNIIQ